MSTDATDGPAGRLRASDAEREEYAEIVRESVGEGRLTLDEGDERLAAVYAVRYRDELKGLITDLPRGQTPADPGASTAAGPGRGARERRGGERGPAGAGAPGPVWGRGPGHPPWGRRRPGFGFGFVVLALGALAIISAATGAHFFWPAIPLIFLGLFLVRGACWARFGYGPRRRW